MATESVKFDRAVEYYDETRGYPPGEEKPVAELIARTGGFSSASHILEIGVGTGRIALPVSAHIKSYYGVDISRLMMQKLKKKQAGEPVYIAEADATRLPFPDNTFDGATAVHIFHLIPDWRGALKEVARVLRPDAPLVHCWSKDSDGLRKLWDTWSAVVPTDSRRPGVEWERNPNFLENEGWTTPAEAQTYTYSVNRTVNGFLNMINQRMWSALWTMTDEEIERGLAAVQPIIETEFPDHDAPIVSSTTIYARAYFPPA